MQLASSAQYLISPFLAGIILTIMDIKFVFLIDVATFLIASSIVIWIRNTLGITQITKPVQNNMADLREGIQEFSKNRGVVNLVITTMLVLFLSDCFNLLLFRCC